MKTLTTAILLALAVTACSNESGQPAETEVVTDGNTSAATADDDTLEPAAPKVEEGEEHNEEAPHSH